MVFWQKVYQALHLRDLLKNTDFLVLKTRPSTTKGNVKGNQSLGRVITQCTAPFLAGGPYHDRNHSILT
jgi:hypothetical protein